MRLLNKDNEIVDALAVPRDCSVRRLSTVTAIVIHTDRRHARNSRVFRDLPLSVQETITSEGWVELAPPNGTSGHPAAPAQGPLSIVVDYQAERGAQPPVVRFGDFLNEAAIS